MDKVDIKVLRIKLGLTQAEFAKKVGVGHVTISRWETGRFSPTQLGREKLAQLDEEVNSKLSKRKL